MKFSDIHVRHLYNVIFDEVLPCEFDGKHLALVLKKNNDNKTTIVMPLTSEPNGVGFNKIKLDKINSLPSSLRENNTYAVYNQIRTVNAKRFISLKEGSNTIQSKIDDKTFENLLSLGITDLLFNMLQDEKIDLLKKLYERECVLKVCDLSYNILSLRKNLNVDESKITRIKHEINGILNNIPNYLEYVDKKHIDNGVAVILNESFINK